MVRVAERARWDVRARYNIGKGCNEGVVVNALSRRRSKSRTRVGGRTGRRTLCSDVNAAVIESD